MNKLTGTVAGILIGAVNCAKRLTGLRRGVFNCAETADGGLQPGRLNMVPQNEWFTGLPNELAPGMILINGRFLGRL